MPKRLTLSEYKATPHCYALVYQAQILGSCTRLCAVYGHCCLLGAAAFTVPNSYSLLSHDHVGVLQHEWRMGHVILPKLCHEGSRSGEALTLA